VNRCGYEARTAPGRSLRRHRGGASESRRTTDHQHVAVMSFVRSSGARAKMAAHVCVVHALSRSRDRPVSSRRNLEIPIDDITGECRRVAGQQALVHADERYR